jgi:ABC-type multidrug transport system permease subunit
MQQISDAQDEATKLRELNATLYGFGAVLDNYSISLDAAKSSNDTAKMAAAIDEASATITSLNSTFASAKEDVAGLSAVISDVREAMYDINSTLDQAMAQTSSVDNLISSLKKTVEEQTAMDPERIASPLAIELQNQYVRTSFVDFLMPQIISISLLFSCFLLASISMVREKTRNTIVRALMSPLGLENMVAGKIATLVLLSLMQVAIIIIVALVLFGVRPPTDLITLAVGAAVSALVLSSIGILIGFYARSESAAIQTCLLLAIPMLFLGNIVFSPDLLPNYTQILQQLLPLAHVTSIFKIVLITNGDPTGDMMALVSYFVLLALAMAFIVIKRRDISNY